jgi:hypothetical protein
VATLLAHLATPSAASAAVFAIVATIPLDFAKVTPYSAAASSREAPFFIAEIIKPAYFVVILSFSAM